MKRITALTAILWGLAAAAQAEVPRVAVDIPPVQSLAARVMQGLGEPDLVVRPGASPHGYAMRPSEAAALEAADVVFFTSGQLTQWLEHALEPLAGRAVTVELLETPGSIELESRQDALFAHKDHGAAKAEDHDHGEGAHDADHDHDADHKTDADHDHGDDEHAHTGVDPHGWLDPENAKAWMATMAEVLAKADPEHAGTYRANAEAGRAEIDAAVAHAQALLDPVKGRPFFVHHDAYQYYEHRFGLEATGSVARSDAAQPGPRRVAELRASVEGMGAVCIFSEPQFNPGLLATVFEGHEMRKAELDPLGTELPLGPGLYPALIETLARDIAGCLAD